MHTYPSTRYKNISNNLNGLVDELLKNENLLKWLTYLVDDPLSCPKVPPGKVLGRQIILTRTNLDVLISNDTKLFVAPRGGKDHRQGILADTIFEVNILSPTKTGYIYPLRLERFSEIASEIAGSLDGKRIAGVGDVSVSTSFNTYKVNELYSGMMLHITTTNQTLGIPNGR